LKTLYLDCYSGISGDMLLGALLDAGLSYKAWLAEVGKLGLSGYTITKKRVIRSGLSGTKVTINVTAKQPHRNLSDITRLIGKSKVSKTAKDNTLRVFGRLAKAEAKAHGEPVEKVHFHEVGAVDSIIDIAGAAIALDMMGIEAVYCSPLNLGSGTVTFSHGTFPVPAPATAELVKGFPAYMSDTKAELTTPTGAAIATTLSSGFGPMPVVNVRAIGYGAGGREIPGSPNMLRVFVGDSDGGYEVDSVNLIETNIDDMDPRIYEYVMERLFDAGALDVWLTPIIMKKSRPAVTLSVLAVPSVTDELIDIVLKETTTFGVRVSEVSRRKLSREFKEVKTRSGTAKVKVGSKKGKQLKAVPEYEEVKALAKKSGRPLKDILHEIENLLP